MKTTTIIGAAFLAALLGVTASAYAGQDHPDEKQDNSKPKQNSHEQAKPQQQQHQKTQQTHQQPQQNQNHTQPQQHAQQQQKTQQKQNEQQHAQQKQKQQQQQAKSTKQEQVQQVKGQQDQQREQRGQQSEQAQGQWAHNGQKDSRGHEYNERRFGREHYAHFEEHGGRFYNGRREYSNGGYWFYAGAYPAWFYQQEVYFIMGVDGLWYAVAYDNPSLTFQVNIE
jgi:TolA-binding protein